MRFLGAYAFRAGSIIFHVLYFIWQYSSFYIGNNLLLYHAK